MKKILFLSLSALLLLSSCKDEITLSQDSVSLRCKGTYQIEAESSSDITYTSKEDFVASVSQSGLVSANHVGSTEIVLDNGSCTEDFKVNVVATYYTYKEPDIEFGETKSSVIAKLGTPDNTTSDGIGYTNYSNSCALIILFENGKVSSYSVLVPSSYTSELSSFLLERYRFLGVSSGVYMYTNSNSSTIVGCQLYNTNYWMVTYMPGDKKNQNSTIYNMIKKNIEELNV